MPNSVIRKNTKTQAPTKALGSWPMPTVGNGDTQYEPSLHINTWLGFGCFNWQESHHRIQIKYDRIRLTEGAAEQLFRHKTTFGGSLGEIMAI